MSDYRSEAAAIRPETTRPQCAAHNAFHFLLRFKVERIDEGSPHLKLMSSTSSQQEWTYCRAKRHQLDRLGGFCSTSESCQKNDGRNGGNLASVGHAKRAETGHFRVASKTQTRSRAHFIGGSLDPVTLTIGRLRVLASISSLFDFGGCQNYLFNGRHPPAVIFHPSISSRTPLSHCRLFVELNPPETV